jgi:uncharacterized protein YajQ (UPF0234 family)
MKWMYRDVLKRCYDFKEKQKYNGGLCMKCKAEMRKWNSRRRTRKITRIIEDRKRNRQIRGRLR